MNEAMMDILRWFLFVLLFAHVIFGEDLVIDVYTSQFPPYNYTTEDIVLTGISTDVVKAVAEEADIEISIKNYPWKRAYQTALKTPNVMIFSIGRTTLREDLFKWGGVIAPGKNTLWILKSRKDITINNIDDIRKYKIGTINNDVIDQYLKLEDVSSIQAVSGQHAYEQNIEKLLLGRIDLWGAASFTALYFLREAEVDHLVEVVYEFIGLTKNDGFYMAFNIETEDSIVTRFSEALLRIKENGVYDSILDSYSVDQYYNHVNP